MPQLEGRRVALEGAACPAHSGKLLGLLHPHIVVLGINSAIVLQKETTLACVPTLLQAEVPNELKYSTTSLPSSGRGESSAQQLQAAGPTGRCSHP